MKEKYPVVFLCQRMGVSKSGYYKWKKRQGRLNRYEQDRQFLTKLLTEQQRHPSHGCHRLAEAVFQETGWIKEELYLDFGPETVENVQKLLDAYVQYFNHRRPAAALGYKSPVQYKTELGF